MGDNVMRIEEEAFWNFSALRFVRLSKTLEYIGASAFYNCHYLEALFLPSTVKTIESYAFGSCSSLRLVILPNDIDLSKISQEIIYKAGIRLIAKTAGVKYEWRYYGQRTNESDRRVNEWLIHHMDKAPFHKLCYNSFIVRKEINDYLTENGNDEALTIDSYHGMTPMHILTMNPHTPAETVAALLNVNVKVAFCVDNEGKIPLNYARDYNVGGLVGMINDLCNHRHAT